MQILEQTITALGPPVWTQPLEPARAQGLLLARWRHADARVSVGAADAVRVVLNLTAGPLVRHAERGEVTLARSVPGQVSVMSAGVASETVVEGRADIVQIFFRPEGLGGRTDQVPADAVSHAELKRAVLRLLVAARQTDGPRQRRAAAQLQRLVVTVLASGVGGTHTDLPPGVRPLAVRRAEGLVSEAMEHSVWPELAEMAAAARLSVSHFVRLFRRAAGVTPHQWVIARRLEQAMELLSQPDARVADVAEAAGFASPAHFVATFRQRLGVTPGAYRQALGGPAPEHDHFSIPQVPGC